MYRQRLLLLLVYIILSTNGQIDIRLPPSIVKGPNESFIFRHGDSITLECKAHGVPAVTYEWKKNGTELNLNAQNIRKEADGTITISPATSIDEGYYQCFAKNKYGTTVSVTSHLERAIQQNEPSHTEPHIGLRPFNVRVDEKPQFAPTLGSASETPTVALIGRSVTLECSFSGNPTPTLTWTGPGNTLPIGRHKLSKDNSEIEITNITPFDEGDYVCSASNSRGHKQHFIKIRVEAVPTFKTEADGPKKVNVTEGESHTFNCNAFAKPEAQVKWYQNTIPLDVDNPPPRFVFSNDKKKLTIHKVCRDCDDRSDREINSDLTVIQCNACNVHGCAFGSGYLNVLKRTKILSLPVEDPTDNMSKEQEFRLGCNATSDPSTPPTKRWYKLKGDNEVLVHEEHSDIKIEDGALVMRVSANVTEKWTKFRGVYKCVADNGYSQAEETVEVFKPQPLPKTSVACVLSSIFWTTVGIAVLVAVYLG